MNSGADTLSLLYWQLPNVATLLQPLADGMP